MERPDRKDRMALEDQMRHEEACIRKYRSYAGRVGPEIRDMFNEFAKDEEGHYRMLSDLLSASGGRSTPVDAFGRQAEWQSTAREMLFQGQAGDRPASSDRDHRWGGLLPGDVADTNHGDLTRGGLHRRGASHVEAAQAYPPLFLQGSHVTPTRPAPVGQFHRWRGEAPQAPPPEHVGEYNRWYGPGEEPANPGLGACDQAALSDMLMTEKLVSGAYDSAVFDSTKPKVRRVLEQIQRDEHRHGEAILRHLGE